MTSKSRGWIKAPGEANAAGRDRSYYGLTGARRKELEPPRQEWNLSIRACDRLAGATMPGWNAWVREHFDRVRLTPAPRKEIICEPAGQLEDCYQESRAQAVSVGRVQLGP
jgi:hypothetical protein